MAVITVRLKQVVYAMLRRAAADQLCDQKDVLEKAIKAFAERSIELAGISKECTPFPPPASRSDELILNIPKRYRRSFEKSPRKLTTTVSEETILLLRKLSVERNANMGDVAERAIRFHLWDQQRSVREGFLDFIYPAIPVGDLKPFFSL